MNSPSSRSIPELFSDAVGQLAKLVGNEFDLARAELSEKAGQAGKAAGMIGAGAVILIPAFVLLLVRGFGSIDPQRACRSLCAYLIVGLGAALLSAGLIAVGMSRLSGGALKPTVTLDQVQRDKVAAKEMVR